MIDRKGSNAWGLVLSILLLAAIGCTCPRQFSSIKKGGDPPSPSATPAPFATASPSATASASYDVTRAKFDQIKKGMKRSAVEAIMGGPGEEYYNGAGGGIRFVSVKYVGAHFKTIFVSYQNDTVGSATQIGL